MEWTDEIIARLRLLWDEGLSTAEIGRRLGISKNSVVGKAHRLDLPARPSPIRRGATPAPRATPRRASGSTLPPLAMPAAPVVVEVPRPAPPRPVLIAAGASRPSPRVPACCWPIGEPGTPNFRFCGDPAMANKPYCQPHAEIAYVRVRDRREEVA